MAGLRKEADAIAEKIEYSYPFMPLSQWLEQELANLPPGTSGRIRIRDGSPPYHVYYGRCRHRRHVHGSVRYANNKITFRSKHIDDAVMAAGVVRAILQDARKSSGDRDVYVFIPKKCPRANYEKPRKETEDPQPRSWWSGMAITIPDGIDEELPFN